ncbi:LIM domain containing 2 [Chelydra serpentina]|uniref:LIM domain containing 2 n=1 Tax=Chelydra serpentina TaxID=8475 RepID=A0A8T1TD32_CHESE|nr:LIM domain containing 2 [Chelydra serpentina]
MMREVCSSCLQPVSSMECVAANKVLLHRSCFCCKFCKRQLSLHNYTAFHGAFYCKVHYKQLAKAREGSEEEKTECKQQDQHLHAMLGSEPRNRYNRAEKKIVEREKLQPRSFHSHPHLSLGPPDGMRKLSSEFVSRNQFRTSWSPLKKGSAEAVRNPDKPGKSEGRDTALNLQTYQAAGSRADGVMLKTHDGKSIAEMAVKNKPSLLPRVSLLKEEGQSFSWAKAGGGKGELRDGEKKLGFMEGNVPRALKGKQGSRVSEKVAVFQQSKPRLESKSLPAISPLALVPVKPPAQGSFISHSKALRATNWTSTTAVQAGALSTAKLLPKDNKLSVTPSTEGLFNEGNMNLRIGRAESVPEIIVNLPELTLSTSSNTQDQPHLEDAGSGPLASHVLGQAETHSVANMVPECGTGGYISSQHKPKAQMHPAEHDAVKCNETACLPSESITPYTVTGSPELGVLVPFLQTAEWVNENSKTDSQEFSGNLMPLTYEANMQGCGEDLKCNGAEVEKVKKMKPESRAFVEQTPGHISQESKREGRAISSAGQAGRTDDQTGSYLPEIESQNTYDPLVNIPQGDILIDVKLSTRDISGSMDTHLNAARITGISHDKPSSSEDTKLKSKGQDNTLGQSSLHISEPLGKKWEAFRSNELADKPETHLAKNGNVDVKPQHENESHGTASAPQGKGTGNGHTRKDTLAKASSLGKNPFARLFASENKGSTSKTELAGKKKPIKPQSAFVTLFGYSSNKERNPKESFTKPSPKLSEQTNNGDQQELSQTGSSSSQSRQKANKKEEASDAVTQIGRAEATPQDSPQSSGYHLGDGLSESFPHSDSTELLGSNVLLLTPGADSLSNARNVHEAPSLEFRDLNVQTAQQGDANCSSLIPSKDSQEESPATKEGRQPPMGPTVAADTSLSLTSEGTHYDTCLHAMENLAGLDDQDAKIKTGTFSTLSHLGASHKEIDLPLEDRDLLESSTLLLSAGASNLKSTSKNFPGISGTDIQCPADSDMQNSQAKDQPSSHFSSSELYNTSPWQRNDPRLLLKSSSLVLMEEDLLDIDHTHGIWNSELLQQSDLDSQLRVDTEDPFGLGLDTRQPTTDHLHTWGDNFQPMSTSTPHVSEPLNDILDTLNTETTAALQQALMIVEESVQAPDLP